MLQLTTKNFIFAGTISLKDFQIVMKIYEDFFECKKGEDETLQDLRNFQKKKPQISFTNWLILMRALGKKRITN